jgi:hypothetical protein
MDGRGALGALCTTPSPTTDAAARGSATGGSRAVGRGPEGPPSGAAGYQMCPVQGMEVTFLRPPFLMIFFMVVSPCPPLAGGSV